MRHTRSSSYFLAGKHFQKFISKTKDYFDHLLLDTHCFKSAYGTTMSLRFEEMQIWDVVFTCGGLQWIVEYFITSVLQPWCLLTAGPTHVPSRSVSCVTDAFFGENQPVSSLSEKRVCGPAGKFCASGLKDV